MGAVAHLRHGKVRRSRHGTDCANGIDGSPSLHDDVPSTVSRMRDGDEVAPSVFAAARSVWLAVRALRSVVSVGVFKNHLPFRCDRFAPFRYLLGS